jgi:hypothetical protein
MLAYHLTSVRSSRGVVPSLVSWLDPPCTTRQKSFFPANCGQENSTHTCSLVQVLKLNLKNTVRGLGVITYF